MQIMTTTKTTTKMASLKSKLHLQPKTLHECVALLCLVQFSVCCNGIWLHKRRRHFIANKWTRLYSLLGALVVLLALAYTIYAIVQNPHQRARFGDVNRLVLSIAVIELVMSSTCMFSLTVLSMQRQTERHIKLYARLAALDQRLMREFSVNLNYHKLLRKNIVVLCIVAAAYVGAICSALVDVVQKDFLVWFLGALCYIVVTGGPHLSGYAHMNLAEIIRIRFRLLQKLMDNEYLMQHFPEIHLRQRRFQSAVEMVRELFELIEEINAIYTVGLIAAIAHDFTLTTSEFYFIFGHSMTAHSSRKMLCYVALCMLLPLYKMCLAPIYCAKTMEEGNKCLTIIKRMDNCFPKNELIQRLVASILLWRMDNKIEFALGMNIKLNKTIVATITILTFNYLLILIQFRMTEEMGDTIEQQKNTIKNWIGIEDFNQTTSTLD